MTFAVPVPMSSSISWRFVMELSLGNSFSPKGHVRVICVCMCIYTSLHKLTKSHTDTLTEAEERKGNTPYQHQRCN